MIAAPDRDCPLCPRLVVYRNANRAKEPGWQNAPVPSFGAAGARLLVVGLAPGLRGANRTGRPFTGDYAGILLYTTLLKFGFAKGQYAQATDDGLEPVDTRITNAVRCVPPENLPTPLENKTCNPFLQQEIAGMPNLAAILALGTLAHQMSLRALGIKLAAHKFAHGALHVTNTGTRPGLVIANSYHVSRYNTSTKRLTTPMFEAVVLRLREQLAPAAAAICS